jgi:hypothetical protein
VTSGVYYLHIAKSAGTTLRWLLEGQYVPPAAMYVYSAADRVRFARLRSSARAHIRCFSTNAPLGAYPDLQARLQLITVLREPVSRVLSLYAYRKAHPTFRGHAIHTLPMLDYFELMASEHEDNAQVRLLSGQGYQGDVNAGSLERAKVNLQAACAAFGLQERFQESLVLFGRVFGWGRMPYVTRNTASPLTLDHMLDITVRAHIEAQHRWDRELYAYAQAQFAEHLAAHPITPEERARFYEAQGLERASIYMQRIVYRLYRLAKRQSHVSQI